MHPVRSRMPGGAGRVADAILAFRSDLPPLPYGTGVPGEHSPKTRVKAFPASEAQPRETPGHTS